MRKAITAVALLGLLAGTVQAKSYSMVGYWREDRTGSETKLYAGAAVDGSTLNSQILVWGATAGVPASQPESSPWDYETPYTVPGTPPVPFVSDGVNIAIKAADGSFINFLSDGAGTNLSKQMDSPAYHPSEFLFTMDIIEWGTTSGSGGTPLEGTLTATWSNDLAPLQTFGPTGNEDAIYGVGPEDLTTDNQEGDYGLFVTVDIPGIPDDAVVPEPLTMLAAGAGMMGLGGYVRRRRRG